MQDGPMRLAAWQAISETGAHQEVARLLRARMRWKCSERSAVARLSQMLNPRDPHQLPADALLDVIDATGRDPFTPILLRRALRKRPLRAGTRPRVRRSEVC
jgi:hypothetical protein